jgi:hypothetical protein
VLLGGLCGALKVVVHQQLQEREQAECRLARDLPAVAAGDQRLNLREERLGL